ncbi:MAG TPA: hypothetical protein VFU48_13310 [Nitrospira sp.]|nr:hypothetical protein [Nitrospira sp.]
MRSATLWREKLSVLLGLTKRNRSISPANVYSETAYHELVHRESKRSARSGHLGRILLVYCTNAQGQVVPFDSELADKTISALFSSCRDTDYIGWYRQGRILGVLLTALRPDFAGEGCDNLRTRLMDGIRSARTFTDDHSLQIRVLEQTELTAFDASDHPAPSSGSKG